MRRPDMDHGDVRDSAPLACERPAPHVAESPRHHLRRIDVHEEQALLESGCASEHRSLVVEDERVPVEDQLVLPADGVAERQEDRVVARPRHQHLLALAVAANMERRRGNVGDELGARERKIRRGRSRLPDVLADRRADQCPTVLEEEEIVAGREVAILVEDAVVGQPSPRPPRMRRRR